VVLHNEGPAPCGGNRPWSSLQRDEVVVFVEVKAGGDRFKPLVVAGINEFELKLDGFAKFECELLHDVLLFRISRSLMSIEDAGLRTGSKAPRSYAAGPEPRAAARSAASTASMARTYPLTQSDLGRRHTGKTSGGLSSCHGWTGQMLEDWDE
jgi:hypothetical protein